MTIPHEGIDRRQRRNAKPLAGCGATRAGGSLATARGYREREAALPKEFGGRGGKEPGRYGDWEVKGLTSDF